MNWRIYCCFIVCYCFCNGSYAFSYKSSPLTSEKNSYQGTKKKTVSVKDIALLLFGDVTQDDKELEGVKLELKKDGTTISTETTTRRGKYKFKLELSTENQNNEYVVVISKPGMVTKMLSVNTYIPKQSLAEVGDDFEYELSITMLVQKDKDVVLQNPSAKITWNRAQRNFGFDQKYARIVQKEEKMFAENPKKYKEYMEKQRKQKEEQEKAKLEAGDKARAEAERKAKEEEEAKRKKLEDEQAAAEALKRSLADLKKKQEAIEKEKKKAEEKTPKGKEIYVVQLASSKTDVDKKIPLIGNLPVEKRKWGDGTFKFTVGNFSDRDKAYALKEEVIKKGIKGAFVLKLPAEAAPSIPLTIKKINEDSLKAAEEEKKKQELKPAPAITTSNRDENRPSMLRERIYHDLNSVAATSTDKAISNRMIREQNQKRQQNLAVKYQTENPLTSLYNVVDEQHAEERGKRFTR